MTYVAAHAAGIALLVFAFYATGALAARVWRPLETAGPRTGLARIGAGIAIWAYWLFLLASVRLFRPWVLIACVIVAAAAGLVALRRSVDARPSTSSGRAVGGSAAKMVLLVLAWTAPAIVLAQLFVRTLGPWLGWDDMTAHLTLPKIYLERGGFVHLPFNVYSHWPSNVQLIYGLGLAMGDYVFAKLLHLAFLALLTVGVYRFAARAAAPWTGVVAASLLLANDVVLVEAPVANIDIAVAFFFFMAVAHAVEFRETGSRPELILSGLFCGCVAGSKITGLGSIACVFPLVVLGTLEPFSLRRRGKAVRNTRDRAAFDHPHQHEHVRTALAHHRTQRLTHVVRDCALFVACAFALALPWLLKSYLYTGDPLYPVLYKYFGGIEWSPALSERFWTWQNSIGMGRTPRDYLLLPVRVILNGSGGYQNFAAWISKTWIVFLPLTLVFTPWVPRARRFLLPAALYFVIWAFSSQQSRFLISVLPLLAVATAVTAGWVVDLITLVLSPSKDGELVVPLSEPLILRQAQDERRVEGSPRAWRQRWRGAIRVALAGLVIAGALTTLGWASRYVRRGSIEATRNLFVDPPNLREWTPDPAYAFVRQHLPPNAKILMLNINHGFFLDRDYVADSFFEASQLNELITAARTTEGITRLFARLGVTHIVMDQAPWVSFPPVLHSYIRDPDHSRVLFRSPDSSLRVYELVPGDVPREQAVVPPR